MRSAFPELPSLAIGLRLGQNLPKWRADTCLYIRSTYRQDGSVFEFCSVARKSVSSRHADGSGKGQSFSDCVARRRTDSCVKLSQPQAGCTGVGVIRASAPSKLGSGSCSTISNETRIS